MTRSNARELAVHLIYSRSFTGEEPETALEARLDKAYYAALSQENEVYAERPSRKQLAYLDQVVVGTANRAQELDETIQRYSIGWDLSRISRLTRAILQLALFECQWVEDVPVGVAVNEAVTLAKKYDGDDAGTFSSRTQHNSCRTESTDSFMRNSIFNDSNFNQIFLSVLYAFADSLRHFICLAHADTDDTVFITNYN